MTTSLAHLPPKNRGRLLLSGLGLLIALVYTNEAYRIGIGNLRRTESGMFPFAVGVIFMVVCVWTAAEALVADYGDDAVVAPRGRRGFVAAFGLLVVALALVMSDLGQYIAASLFASLSIRLLSGRSWIQSILWGIAIAVVLSYFFIELLGVMLPEGNVLR